MRILHVTAQKPEYTGSGIYLKNAIAWARSRGYAQALVAGIHEEDRCGLQTLGIPVYDVVFQNEQRPFAVPGMSDVMPYESLRYDQLAGEQLEGWNQAFEEVLQRARKAFRPDVVLSHHLWLLTAKARQVFGDIPVMGICHGSDLRQMKRNPHLGETVVSECRQLDLVFALNEHQKREIQTLYGCEAVRIRVTGAGYDDAIFHPPERLPANPVPTIIYAGKLARAKGLFPLLAAFGALRKKRPARLLLAGTGGDSGELEKLAPTDVRFLGRVSQQELAAQYRQADLFVLPSYFEGLPLVLLEALGSGLSCVCSDLPGVRDWLGPQLSSPEYIRFVPLPRLVRGDEPLAEDIGRYTGDLQAAMEFMLDNSADRQLLGRLAARGSWAEVFRRIEEEIRNKL